MTISLRNLMMFLFAIAAIATFANTSMADDHAAEAPEAHGDMDNGDAHDHDAEEAEEGDDEHAEEADEEHHEEAEESETH